MKALLEVNFLCIVLNLSYLIALSISIYIFVKIYKGQQIQETFFFVLGSIAIICSKAYLISINEELDFDETIHLVQAQSVLQKGYIYWRDMASGSSGPTNTYLIVIYGWLIRRMDWITVHSLYVILLSINWALFYSIITNFFKKKTQLIAGIPLLFFINLQNFYLLNYHTELVGFTFLMIALWLYSIFDKKEYAFYPLFLGIGVLFFLVGISKLQLIPLTFFLFCFIVFHRKTDNLRKAVTIFIGFTISLFILLLASKSYDFYDKMLYYYIERNMNYSSGNIISNLMAFISNNNKGENQLKETGLFYVLSIQWVLVLFTLFIKWKLLKKKDVFFILGLGIIVLYSIFKSGKSYPHYFYLTFYPTFFVFALMLNKVNVLGKYLKGLLIIFFVVGIVNKVYIYTLERNIPFKGLSELDYSQNRENEISKTINNGLFLNKISPQKAKMAIWGYEIKIHIISGIDTATPDSHIDYILQMSKKNAAKTLKLYLNALINNKPEVFIVCQAMNKSFETISPLRTYIKGQYIEYYTNEYYRVFLRKKVVTY